MTAVENIYQPKLSDRTAPRLQRPHQVIDGDRYYRCTGAVCKRNGQWLHYREFYRLHGNSVCGRTSECRRCMNSHRAASRRIKVTASQELMLENEMPTSKYARWSNSDIAEHLVQSVNGTLDNPGNLIVCGVTVESAHPQSDAKAIRRSIIELLMDVRADDRK